MLSDTELAISEVFHEVWTGATDSVAHAAARVFYHR